MASLSAAVALIVGGGGANGSWITSLTLLLPPIIELRPVAALKLTDS